MYGISDNEEVRTLRRFSDIDYISISRKDARKPYYKTSRLLRTSKLVAEMDVSMLNYDSCMGGLETDSLVFPLTFVKFMVPLFDSQNLFLELTGKAMSKILARTLYKAERLITPSYAMMKINDARIRYQPYRWWSVHGEFILSPNANSNIQVYYDRVASTMEELCKGGLLTKVGSPYVEPVYDTSKFVVEGGES